MEFCGYLWLMLHDVAESYFLTPWKSSDEPTSGANLRAENS